MLQIDSNNELIIDGKPIGLSLFQAPARTVVYTPPRPYVGQHYREHEMPHQRYSVAADVPDSGVAGCVQLEADLRDLLLRLKPAKINYLMLDAFVDDSPPTAFESARSLRSWLLSAGEQLPKDEIQDSGILDWLYLKGNDGVTKSEVADYLNRHIAEIEAAVRASDPLVRREGESLFAFAVRNGMPKSRAESVSLLADAGEDDARVLVAAYRNPCYFVDRVNERIAELEGAHAVASADPDPDNDGVGDCSI